MNIPIASQTINFPGYGLFWVANSISSTILGKANRNLREKASERSEEFQKELRRAQELTDNQRLQEEMAFKRRLLDLSRQYRSEQTAIQFNNQLKAVELKQYLQYCWPLDPLLPDVFLKDICNNRSELHPKLNVILMHAQLLQLRKLGGANEQDAEIYRRLEYAIVHDDVPAIGHLKYHKDAGFKDASRGIACISGGNANIMNIHFLMSQLPTLVISPFYRDGLMYFSGAVWEPQAARPLIRPLFNYEYDMIEVNESKEYRNLMIDKFHAAVSIITGSVRDSYVTLTQGGTPTLSHWLNDGKHSEMKELIKKEDGIKNFVLQENQAIVEALEQKNTPQLLEAYSETEIKNIKEQVQSINL